MRCPGCKKQVELDAWICPFCDYILDPSVLDRQEAGEASSPLIEATKMVAWDSPLEDSIEEVPDAMILGDVSVEEDEFQLVQGAGAQKNGQTSTFLYYAAGTATRVILPSAVPHLLDAPDTLPRTPYEDFVMSQIDGVTTVREIQRHSGLAVQEVVVTLLTLMDKGLVSVGDVSRHQTQDLDPPTKDDGDMPMVVPQDYEDEDEEEATQNIHLDTQNPLASLPGYSAAPSQGAAIPAADFDDGAATALVSSPGGEISLIPPSVTAPSALIPDPPPQIVPPPPVAAPPPLQIAQTDDREPSGLRIVPRSKVPPVLDAPPALYEEFNQAPTPPPGHLELSENNLQTLADPAELAAPQRLDSEFLIAEAPPNTPTPAPGPASGLPTEQKRSVLSEQRDLQDSFDGFASIAEPAPIKAKPPVHRAPVQEKRREPPRPSKKGAAKPTPSAQNEVAGPPPPAEPASNYQPTDSLMGAKAKKLFEQALLDKTAGNLVSARMNMKLALTFDPENPEYQKALEQLSKNPQATAKPMEQSRSKAKEYYDAATESENIGDYDAAIGHLEMAIKESKQPAFYNRLGVLLATKKKEFVRAQQLIEEAIERAPGNAIYERNLAKVLSMAASVGPRKDKAKRGGILGFFARRRS